VWEGWREGRMGMRTIDDVEYEETSGILVLRCQTCRVTTSRGICFGVVDAEHSAGGRGECKVHLSGLCWVGVASIAY